MGFDWDQTKNRQNRRRHGVAFEDAQQLFESGADYLEIFDAEHSGTKTDSSPWAPLAKDCWSWFGPTEAMTW